MLEKADQQTPKRNDLVGGSTYEKKIFGICLPIIKWSNESLDLCIYIGGPVKVRKLGRGHRQWAWKRRMLREEVRVEHRC